MIKNKKGEEGGMTVGAIVTIVLLVISLIVIVYFFWQVGFGSRTDKEACHQSVIVRGTLPAFANIQTAAPLKCQTEKICITSKLFGGSCAEFNNTKGITTVRVGTKTEVEKLIAQTFFDCWEMMGEGKISLFSQWIADQYGFGGIASTCTVCSRIAFDSASLAKAGINASEINVEKYMDTHLIPNKDQTYTQYMSGEGGQIRLMQNLSVTETTPAEQQTEFEKLTDEQKSSLTLNENDFEAGTLTTLNYSIDTLGIIFTQISAPTHWGSFSNLAGSVLGGLGFGAVTTPGTFFRTAKSFIPISVSVPAGEEAFAGMGKYGEYLYKKPSIFQRVAGTKITANKAGIKAGAIVGAVALLTGVAQQVNVAYDRSVATGVCGDISIGSEAADGCSVVRLIKYNATDLNSYCSIIESIP